MQLNLLTIGDVTSDSAIDHLARHLPSIQKLKGIDFTICNGENASVIGILPRQAESIFACGVDVITLGNHAWGQREIQDYLEEHTNILRPHNSQKDTSGVGSGLYTCKGMTIAVLNLIGRHQLEEKAKSPFLEADEFLEKYKNETFRLVEFHAEATAEKLALAYYVDGRASALWGTHTHVPTADNRVFPKGTGYITDLGMTGPIESVIGIPAEQSIAHFTGGNPGYYRSAGGPCKMQGCIFTLDADTGLCVGTERINIE